MAQGKFSNPRPHRDEERQIEEAFRQVTHQSAPRRRKPDISKEDKIQETIRQMSAQEPVTRQLDLDGVDLDALAAEQASPIPTHTQEDAQIEQAFQQVTGQPVPQNASAQKKQRTAQLRQNLENFLDGGDFAYDGVPEEEPDEQEPDFIDRMQLTLQRFLDFLGKNQKIAAIAACGVAVILICFILGMFVAGSSDPYDSKILSNVYIADINVGGMKQEEAIAAVKQAIGSSYTTEDMVIDLSGHELRLRPKDTDANLNVKSAVEEAYSYGRTGTQEQRDAVYESSLTQDYVIDILPHLGLDTDYIRKTLQSSAEDTGSTLVQTTYGLEGEEPELSADKFDEKAPTQTLVITLGTPGIGFDADAVYDQVLFAYRHNTFLVTVEDVENVKDPDPIDLQDIYDEFYIEPVEASVNTSTLEATPGSYGYGFDLEEAQKLLDKAEFGEEIRIPMEYIEPELLDAGAFFSDTLGKHQTRYTSNSSRTTNLKLACQAIDDLVLMPGDTLTFSSRLNRVGGFQYAPEDTGKEDTAQGGVSQVSSTLYYAALMSDLEIVSRSNLGYIPSFIEAGLDAAPSLKIRNSLGYPVRIEAQASGGYVKVQIIGTEERDYYVTLSHSIAATYEPETEYEDFEHNNAEGYLDGDILVEGSAGYLVKTFKNKYSIESGSRVGQDFIANSQYPTTNRLVARVEEPETTEPPTQPTTKPTETEKPTEATKPTEAPKPTETTLPSSETTAPAESSEPAADNTRSTEAATVPQENPATLETTEAVIPDTPAE